ncbi:MAG TPA: protein jag, partial [Clostridiales bacterium]|nr:protein jag [Clostridiales bacterium]
MSTDNIFSGKTVEEALNKALRQLNASKEQVKYTVLEEGKSGFLGIGGKPAKIQVELISSDCDLEKRVSDFLKGLFSFLNVEADVSVEEDENTITITLNSNDNAQLIGYRGEILDSLQTLAGAIANKNRETYKRVLINCEGYREKREETLKALAVKLADKAVAKGRKIKLEPMNPFE